MIQIDSREGKAPKFASIFVDLGFTDFKIEKTKRVNGRWPSDFTLHQSHRTIGVQRKTISDFVGSLDKLKETMQLGRSEFDVFVLLLEGLYELNGDRISYRRGQYFHDSVSSASLHNFLFSQALRGSPMIRTHSIEETARALLNLYSYTGPGIEVASNPNPTTHLEALPSIGQDKAQKIASFYGSVWKALLNIDRWGEVEGIGSGTMEQIMSHLDTEGIEAKE